MNEPSNIFVSRAFLVRNYWFGSPLYFVKNVEKLLKGATSTTSFEVYKSILTGIIQ